MVKTKKEKLIAPIFQAHESTSHEHVSTELNRLLVH